MQGARRMLYKVTPLMPQEKEQTQPPRSPRKRRKSAVYDHEGNEILLSLSCLKCRVLKPLAQFGLRKMADGAIRNQPWCRQCRSGAKAKPGTPTTETPAQGMAEVVELTRPQEHEG